jgi:hypothetical protein|eukprot:scaffold844_cov268-Chaetoceros_neogracile.AAC.37
MSKRVTIPQLSPTHTSARIIKLLQPHHGADSTAKDAASLNSVKYPLVQSYDCIMILECSADLIADPADRDYVDQQLHMIVETCDEGLLKLNNDVLSKMEQSGNSDISKETKTEWMPIGTQIGVIDDDEEIDGDWIWQAYFHDGSESKYP